MRRQLLNCHLPSTVFDNVPYDPFRHTIAPSFARAANTPKQAAFTDAGGSNPRVDSRLDPRWHWNCSHMSAFADQIDYRPVFLPLLNVRNLKLRCFPAAQTAAQQNRN